MRGSLFAALLLLGCSRKDAASVPPSAPSPFRLEKLTLVPPSQRPLRAGVPATFRLESNPPLSADQGSEWMLRSPKEKFTLPGRGAVLDATFPSGGIYFVQAKAGTIVSNIVEVAVTRVTLVDAEERPLREGRLALLSREAFDANGRLREDAAADRVRVLVEDPEPAEPEVVSVGTLTLPLNGPAGRRLTRPFLLLGDREDAAAAGAAALPASAGARVEFSYRGAPAGGFNVGPAVIHEIPVRFVAVGPAPDLERAVDLRLAQANAVWEPLGRRFTRGPIVRLDQVRGVFLVRGRAAGADGQGRPSRCGVILDGRELSVPAAWRNDGAPMTPKAAVRALIEKAGKSFQLDLFEGLIAGDREALVVRVRRPDGTPAAVERLVDGQDVAQALTPLSPGTPEGIEVAPSAGLLSLEEIALLASGKGAPSAGFDVFLVPGLHSLGARPAFKVYPEALFPSSMSGSAIVSWALLDGSGRYPYGLARVAGELLLPPGFRPGPGDSLFADPLSEAPGVDVSKRVTAATGSRIAERGRGLAGRK